MLFLRSKGLSPLALYSINFSNTMRSTVTRFRIAAIRLILLVRRSVWLPLFFLGFRLLNVFTSFLILEYHTACSMSIVFLKKYPPREINPAAVFC